MQISVRVGEYKLGDRAGRYKSGARTGFRGPCKGPGTGKYKDLLKPAF